jgi:hypothetical protein
LLSGVVAHHLVFRALKSAASDVLAQPAGVDDTGDPQCPPEGPTPFRQGETGRVGVKVRTPAGEPAPWVGYNSDRRAGFFPAWRLSGVLDLDVPTRDDPQ